MNADQKKFNNIVFCDMAMHKKLNEYLREWENNYMYSLSKIDLFKKEIAESLTEHQMKFFVRSFYHIRGHFYKFLWCVGNNAPTKKIKKLILDNFSEEFGDKNPSHESLGSPRLCVECSSIVP